ncbi:MAG: radical SAM family heme chaperone HemW [Bdellovibrionota bacterium]
MRARSLYVHFPFCETKCHYCDFYSLGRERTREGDADQYELALGHEAALHAPLLAQELDTIFFGGGTPSMTPPETMERTLAPLFSRARVTPGTEWTMEANPSSVTLDSLRDYRAFGVNRISMGVQAMRDDLLARLGRVHSRDKALEALSAIFEAGFDNVSVDLLCGVPGQSIEDLRSAMTTLSAFPITHLSCYLLTLPKHHKMFAELPDEDTQLEHLLFIDRFMSERGFEHYEISNFAKPGKRARHNLAYWKGESYLGLGPSAHSFDAEASRRWKNISSLHKYASELEAGRSAVEWTETLTSDQRALEKWMLALRLDEGFPESWLASPLQKARAARLLGDGLLERRPGLATALRLTPRGFALSDQVIAALSG